MAYFRILLVLVALFLSGCNDGDKTYTDPYKKSTGYPHKSAKAKKEIKLNIAQSQLKMQELKNNHDQQLASIVAKKETRAKELELEKIRIESKARLELASKEQKSKAALQEQKARYGTIISRGKNRLYLQYLIAASSLITFVLLIYILVHNRNQKLKAKIHENELRHKEYMQASKQHHERINKTLEIIADGTHVRVEGPIGPGPARIPILHLAHLRP